ncbi:MAG: ABC transporter permease [Spirochaetales bacterium]|jgi:phospholipid/cholesterol/gamma-HCH transport system permease protein|nr:ABC transporter permease [Spirochaetales bacterium]
MHNLVKSIGEYVIRSVTETLYAAGYVSEVLKRTFRFLRHIQPKYGYRVLIMQILFTGFEALWIIAIISLALGALIIIQGRSFLAQLGQGQLVYPILITVITRELGPILTAFIIIARSGTAMATELGYSIISHEIEAYQSFGINPIGYLIVPRFLGVTISMVVLNLYFNIFGLLGSFIVSQFIRPLQIREYAYNLLTYLTTADVFSALLKSFIFGAIISCTATYYGFRVERASTEIPQIAIKAVSRSFVLCILADAIITLVYYL